MRNDLTRGSPMRALFFFSLPMLAGNVVQQFYNMVDLMVVGRYVGVNALAAVGATSSTMFFIFSLVAGLTNGASVVVSQYYGYGDNEKTRRTIAMSIYVLGAAGVALTFVGTVITRPIMNLLNTPPEIIEGAVAYLQVIMTGVLATVVYNSVANILRAMGDSITPLVFLILAALLNIGLDLLFVITFRMGVAGAAWATVLAQALSAVACIIYAVKKKPIMQLKKSDFKFDGLIVWQTIKMGAPGGLQNSLIALGGMTVQSVVNTFGAQVVAAYAGATKLDQLVVQPLLSLSMANATYSAQNMGAGLVERVRKGFWSCTAMIAIFCAAATPTLLLFGQRLMTLFVDSSETAVLAIGQSYFNVMAPCYFAMGVLILFENMLRGAGDVMIPLISNFTEIIVRVIAAYWLAEQLGYRGIWWAGPISWAPNLVICVTRYVSGKWEDKALVSREFPEERIEPGSNE